MVSRLKILLANIGRLAYYKAVINGEDDWTSFQSPARLINLQSNILKRSSLIPKRLSDEYQGITI